MSKLFCIGLSNTGKHSLMASLEILGYSTIHYPKSFKEIALYDVACDAFVWTHFKDLDQMHAESMFIYTTRDEKEWLESTIKHLEVHPAQSKSQFKRGMRVKAWGDENPSEDQLLRARKVHEKDIQTYFGERRQDLLTIDIPNGEGWEKLCPFLGQTIPEQEFPHIDTSA